MSPVYEFTCPACGSTVSINQPIDQPTPEQQTCACEQPMQRIWATPAITFKGTGWGKDK